MAMIDQLFTLDGTVPSFRTPVYHLRLTRTLYLTIMQAMRGGGMIQELVKSEAENPSVFIAMRMSEFSLFINIQATRLKCYAPSPQWP